MRKIFLYISLGFICGITLFGCAKAKDSISVETAESREQAASNTPDETGEIVIEGEEIIDETARMPSFENDEIVDETVREPPPGEEEP